LALLKQLAPSVTRVAVLRNPDTLADVAPLWGYTETEARKLGVQLHVHDVRNMPELSQAFDTMPRDGAEVLLVLPDPTFTANRGRIAELAAKRGIPTMYEAREFVVAGGLVSYAASLIDQFSRAAVYVDKILKGAKPADLPVEQPTKFELVVNLNELAT
jgi:putative tryptophan/tyrosine transport system substrate-binding protein